MNNKYYIVQEIGYQYNDETYDKSDGGTPVKIFADKKSAQEYVNKLTYNKILDIEINCYGFDDVIRNKYELAAELIKITGREFTEDDLDQYDFQLPKMTYYDFNKIKKYLDIELYQICECDGEIEQSIEPRKKASKTSILKSVELKNTDGHHNKIWRGTLYSNLDVITEWGRIGTELQHKEFSKAGEEFLDKKINEKLKKGYEYN